MSRPFQCRVDKVTRIDRVGNSTFIEDNLPSDDLLKGNLTALESPPKHHEISHRFKLSPMIFCHKVLAWVVLSLGLKRKKARAFEGLKNGLGLTPCKAQQVGLWAFVSLGACFFKHRMRVYLFVVQSFSSSHLESFYSISLHRRAWAIQLALLHRALCSP